MTTPPHTHSLDKEPRNQDRQLCAIASPRHVAKEMGLKGGTRSSLHCWSGFFWGTEWISQRENLLDSWSEVIASYSLQAGKLRKAIPAQLLEQLDIPRIRRTNDAGWRAGSLLENSGGSPHWKVDWPAIWYEWSMLAARNTPPRKYSTVITNLTQFWLSWRGNLSDGCLDQVGLFPCLWGDCLVWVELGRPSPFWVAPFPMQGRILFCKHAYIHSFSALDCGYD